MGNHKRRKNGLGERMLAVFLALAMVFTLLPMDGLQVRAKAEGTEPEFTLSEFHLTDSNWTTDSTTGYVTGIDRNPSVSMAWTMTGLEDPGENAWYDAELYVSPNNLSTVKSNLSNLASMNSWPADSPKRTHISGLGNNYWQTSITRNQMKNTGGEFTHMLQGNFMNLSNACIQDGDTCTWQLVIYKRTKTEDEPISEEVFATEMAQTTVDWSVGLPYMNEKHMEIAYQWPGMDNLSPDGNISYEAQIYVWPQDGLEDPYNFPYGWGNTVRWSEEVDFNVLMGHGAWSDCLLEKNGTSAWFCNDGTFGEGESLTPAAGSIYTTGLIINKIDRSSGTTKVTEYRRSPAVEFTVSSGTDEGSGMGPGETSQGGTETENNISTSVSDMVTEYLERPVNLTFTGKAVADGTLAWTCSTTDQYNSSGNDMGLPLGLEFQASGNTASITGTPTLNTRAPMTVTITLTETAGSTVIKSTKTFTLNVNKLKPKITSPTKLSVMLGEPFSITLTGTPGYEEDSLSWEYEGSLPDGVSFDKATGTLSGTITTAGKYSFNLALLENTSAGVTRSSVSATFTITATVAEHSNEKPVVDNVKYDTSDNSITLDFTTKDTATGYFDVFMITENKPEYDPADTTPATFSKPGVSGSWYLYARASLDYGTDGVTFDRATGEGRLKMALDASTLTQGIKNLPTAGEVYYFVLQTEGIPEGGQPGQGSAYSSNAYLKVPLADPQNVYVSIGTYQDDDNIPFDVNMDPSNPSLEEFSGGKWVVAVVMMDKDEDLIYQVTPMKEDLSKVATGNSGYVTYAKDKYDRNNWQWCDHNGNVLNPDNPWSGYNPASIDSSMGTIPVSVYQFPGTTADFEEGMKGFYDGEDLIIGIQAISKEDPSISSNLVTVRVPLNKESKNITFRPSDLNEEDDPVTPDPVITQPSVQYTAKTIYSTDTSDFTLTKSDGSFTFDSIQCDGETLTLNTDYTKAEKAVTLKQSWLSTLSVGEHTVIFHYTASEGIEAEARDPQLKLTLVEKVSPVVSVAGHEKADITSHCNITWYTNSSRTTKATLPVIAGTKLYYTVTPGDDLKIGGVQYYKEARGEVTLNEEGQEVKVKLPMQGSVTLEPVLKGGTKLKKTDQAGYTVSWS
ncbi:MAG: putative Ig domain-containing protein, partial [Lachnospiraceae bacterium]|nr:putative Ig domain-containing protein [Lachnospiraceae bacterium]